jgi:RimJ/RimL family protein N-acetyltransferase
MSTIPEKQITLKDGRPVTIRTARPSDAGDCIRFMERVLAESDHLLLEPGEFTMTIEQERAWLKERLDAFSKICIVAESPDGQIVSICGFDGNDTRRRLSHTGLVGISILRDYRNQGLGRAMLTELIAWATAHPAIERLALAVFADNVHAIGLYESLGFKTEASLHRSIKLAPNQYADELLMARWLK